MVNKNLKGSIITLRKENKSMNEIATLLNCSKSTVSYHCKNEGLAGQIAKWLWAKPKVKYQKIKLTSNISNDVIEKIILYRRECKSYKQISKELGISKDKVSIICKENNINKIGNISQEKIDEIIYHYNITGNMRVTAKIVGVSRPTVRNHVVPRGRRLYDEKQSRAKKVQWVTQARQRRKVDLIDYKGGKCQNCEYDRSIAALQFHHIDPKEKDFTIGGRNYSWEMMKNEVDKCVLVCANCHAEIHEEIRIKGESEIINKINFKILQ